jgi:hypothetical protein
MFKDIISEFWTEYSEISKHHWDSRIKPVDAWKQAKSFSDSKGNTFSCIGYGGKKYGPTLIWQISK